MPPRRHTYTAARGGALAANEIPVELHKIMNRKAPDAALEANDVLYIPDASGTKLALDKIMMFGSASIPALIYAGVNR